MLAVEIAVQALEVLGVDPAVMGIAEAGYGTYTTR